MTFDLATRLVETVGSLPAGSAVQVQVNGRAEVDVVRTWCEATGNAVLAVHPDSVEIHRGRVEDPIEALPAEMRPGYRLWVYTNFHCNLACDYCCVNSSPRTPARVLDMGDFADLVGQAAEVGVRELYLTGGEPFLLRDMDERLRIATDRLPTTVLTNASVWTGERGRRLASLPRERLTLQVSLDSADPELHDAHRGAGAHARALDGLQRALDLGFRVRVAATLGPGSDREEQKLRALLDELGLDEAQQVIRRIARQGAANKGLVVSRASLVPEICVTSEGVWWHPVAAADATMKVVDTWRPLSRVVDVVTREFREHRVRGNVLASTFPCA